MEHLLTPDPGLIIWTIVTFLVLVFVLGKFAWKPLLKALDERELAIRRNISEAQGARDAAEKLKGRYEQDLSNAQQKIQAMIAQAQADAQKIREELLKKAEEEAQRLSAQTRRQLEEDKAKISRELRKEVAAFSIQAAEKLIRHSMNQKEQDALLQEFFKDLDKEPTK